MHPTRPPRPGQAEAAPTADKTPDAAKPENGVLAARKGPVLSVETIGPRTISVGRESTYEVGIANSGDVPAEGLIVFVSLPDWAEVAGAGASARLGRDGRGTRWRVAARNHPVESRQPERQGTRAADVEDRSAAEPLVRPGGSLVLQAAGVAGLDRSAGAEALAATGRPPRGPLRQEATLSSEAGQHRHRQRRERRAHAVAHRHRGERAGLAPGRTLARRTAEDPGGRVDRPANRKPHHPGRGPRRGRRTRRVGREGPGPPRRVEGHHRRPAGPICRAPRPRMP